MRVTLIQTDTLHVEALISRESSHAKWHVAWLVHGETPTESPALLPGSLHESDVILQARKIAERLYLPCKAPFVVADLPETPPAV